MVSISIHSPRRSPRISDPSSKRQSPRLSARQSAGIADIGGRNGSEARISPSNVKGKSSARRAYSLGGDHLKRSFASAKDKDNTISIVPSRRNVPGPRKSAIRAAPPQVFASPTISDPVPIIRTSSSSGDGFLALGGNDLVELMQSFENSRPSSSSEGTFTQPGNRKSIIEVDTVAIEENEVESTIVRKKRRVTFNPYQERNDFDWQEPTISIRPSGETELVTVESNSSNSNESSDMSLDSEDSIAQSEEDAEEVSMEITAAYSETSSVQKEIGSSQTISDDSAMDMTAAIGGVYDTTGMSRPSGQGDSDEDSAFEDASMSSNSTPRQDNGDQTVTMQFTSFHGGLDDDSMAQMTEEEEGDDIEVEMQLEEISNASDGGIDRDEENSAMDLTETYSPNRANITAESSFSHASAPRRSMRESMAKSPSPKKGHEFCHMPAAESPKQHLSSATMKAIARRQSLAKSPIKRENTLKIGSLGSRSSASPVKSDSVPASTANRQSNARPSLPASKIPLPSSLLKSRKSSPPRKPASPSKPANNLRKSTGWISPGKRTLRYPESPHKPMFGSPQRIRVASPDIQMNITLSGAANSLQTSTNKTVMSMKNLFSSLGINFANLEMPHKMHIGMHSIVKEEAKDSSEKIKAACGGIRFLDSLVEACEELKGTVEEGTVSLAKMEVEFQESPPLYISEVNAFQNEEERLRAKSAFLLQRSAARANALQAYYDWRAEKQFDDPALKEWEEIRKKLEADVQLVRSQMTQVKGTAIPVLQKRRRELVEEIAKEKKRLKKIEEGEKQELSELHRAMEEQGSVLNEQRSVQEDAKKYLSGIQRQLSGIAQESRDLEEKLILTRKLCSAHRVYTKEEASRLVREIEEMGALHLWRIQSATLNCIVLELEDTLELTLLLMGKKVSKAKVMICNSQLWQDILQEALDKRLSNAVEILRPAAMVRLVTCIWTRMRHFTRTIEALHVNYPTELSMTGSQVDQKMIIKSAVLLPEQKSKIIIEVHCSISRLVDCKGPVIEENDINARCVYGGSKVSTIKKRIASCYAKGQEDVANIILQAVDALV